MRVQYLGRAPLYDSAGRLIKRQEPDRFIADKPVTPKEDSKVAAAPVAPVDVRSSDGKRLLKLCPMSKKSACGAGRGVFPTRKCRGPAIALGGICAGEIVEVEMGGATLYRVKWAAPIFAPMRD